MAFFNTEVTYNAANLQAVAFFNIEVTYQSFIMQPERILGIYSRNRSLFTQALHSDGDSAQLVMVHSYINAASAKGRLIGIMQFTNRSTPRYQRSLQEGSNRSSCPLSLYSLSVAA